MVTVSKPRFCQPGNFIYLVSHSTKKKKQKIPNQTNWKTPKQQQKKPPNQKPKQWNMLQLFPYMPHKIQTPSVNLFHCTALLSFSSKHWSCFILFYLFYHNSLQSIPLPLLSHSASFEGSTTNKREFEKFFRHSFALFQASVWMILTLQQN